jgi:hypothetical protein
MSDDNMSNGGRMINTDLVLSPHGLTKIRSKTHAEAFSTARNTNDEPEGTEQKERQCEQEGAPLLPSDEAGARNIKSAGS